MCLVVATVASTYRHPDSSGGCAPGCPARTPERIAGALLCAIGGDSQTTAPRIVPFGPMGIGKSTAIRTLCGELAVDCDVPNLDLATSAKATTTVERRLRRDSSRRRAGTAYLWQPRSRERFSFMREWLMMSFRAVGAIVLVDLADRRSDRKCRFAHAGGRNRHRPGRLSRSWWRVPPASHRYPDVCAITGSSNVDIYPGSRGRRRRPRAKCSMSCLSSFNDQRGAKSRLKTKTLLTTSTSRPATAPL